MGAKMKIGGDASNLKKEIMSLGREIESLGTKRKVQIFDKETQKFIEDGAKIAISSMQRELEKLNTTNAKISNEMKTQKMSQDQIAQKTLEHLRNKSKILSLEKDIAKVGKQSVSLLQSPKALDALIQGAKKGGGGILSKIPGVGRVAGGLKSAGGIGALGLVGGGLAAAAIGAGAFAIGRGVQGFNQFAGGIKERVALTGRGLGGRQATGVFEPAQRLGMSLADLRRAQLQAVDVFGRKGATQEEVTKRARTARGLGISVEQLQTAGQGLRRQLGVGGAQKTFAKLQATLMATELSGAVGPWLETTANMLTDINENGIGLDDAALHAMQQLSQIEGMSPERVMKVMSGLDESMKSATGEKAAFFMSALAGQGIGGGTLGGTQVAMQMGLFGGDISKVRERGLLSEKDISALESMKILVDPTAREGKGGIDAFKERMEGITSVFDHITSSMGVIGKMLVAQKITGVQGPLEALETIEAARKAMQTTDPKKRQAIIDDMTDKMRTPQEKMVDRLNQIVKSTAGTLEVSQAFKQANLEILGEEVAPLATSINEHLANIDKFLASMLGLFGVETVAEVQETAAREGRLNIKKFEQETPERQKELQKIMQQEQTQTMTARLEREERFRVTGGGKFGMAPGIKEALEKEARQDVQLIEIHKVLMKIERQGRKPSNTNQSGRGEGT